MYTRGRLEANADVPRVTPSGPASGAPLTRADGPSA